MPDAHGLDIFISETGRRYVNAADVARICGIEVSALDRQFRPPFWAMPRDFVWHGKTGKLWFAELSLQQLVDSLFDGAQSDAAVRLRTWLVDHLAKIFSSHEKERGILDNLKPAEFKSWAQTWEERQS